MDEEELAVVMLRELQLQAIGEHPSGYIGGAINDDGPSRVGLDGTFDLVELARVVLELKPWGPGSP